MNLQSPPVQGFTDEEACTRDTQETAIPAVVSPRDRATLIVIGGPDPGRVCTIGDEVLIGRGIQCQLHIDDPGVSRVHARIALTDGQYVVHDMGARNGLFVNGEKVQTRVLRHGDRMQLGPAVTLGFAMACEQEESLMRTLYRSSVRDPLTGVFNRGHFEERLASEIAYAVRHRTNLTVVMLDIDFFKKVNDRWGHQAGDQVLKEVGNLLTRAVRAEDVLCRYGGEEFAAIARGIDLAGALAMAERIRRAVAVGRIPWENDVIAITLSAGVASLSECGQERSGRALVEIADRRLYEAKQTGRNRVVGG